MQIETLNAIKGWGCATTILLASLIAWYTGYRIVRTLWEAAT